MRLPTTALLRAHAALATLAVMTVAAVAVPDHARGATPASAANAPQAVASLAQPSPTLPGLPSVSLALSAVQVDSPAFRREQARYQALAGTLTEAQAARAGIDRELGALHERSVVAERALAGARARTAAIRAHLNEIDDAIADLAIGLYTSGGPSARVDAALGTSQPSINETDRRDVLGVASLDVLLAERARSMSRLGDAMALLRTQKRELRGVSARSDALAASRPAAVGIEVNAAPPVAAQRATYEQARILAPIPHAGFPLVALDAYYRAAELVAHETPRCGVAWWAVAGISRVEGHHGSYGGAVLDEHGNPSKRIIGIPLDGTNNTRIVQDSDRGVLDGDTTYDRAVGPMQFIPQTWDRFAADGNGDGTVTPFNLYDSTLAAARYLCHARSGLDADSGLRAAYFSYNQSDEYVSRVLEFARLYERIIDVPAATD